MGNFEGFVERFKAGAQVAMLNLPGLDVDIESQIDMYRQFAEKIRPMVVDSVSWLTKRTRSEKNSTFWWRAPTRQCSTLTTAPIPMSPVRRVAFGVCTGLGLPPCAVGDVFGVA